MYKEIKLRVTGVQPLLLSNIQTANPLNKWAKALKEVTSKKKKTDADTLEIIRLQFMSSWYVNKEGQYVLPSDNLLKSFEMGAKEFKMGTKFIENAYIVEDDLVLEFDGQGKTLDELYDGGESKYVDTRLCGIGIGAQKAKVLATRALIDQWSLVCTLKYDEDQLNLNDVMKAAEIGGLRKAVGTYRKKFGRYRVEIVK